MRTLIIEIETDSNASLKKLRNDLQQEIGSCTHYFDTDNMSVQDKPEGRIIILPVPVGTTIEGEKKSDWDFHRDYHGQFKKKEADNDGT